MILLTILVMRTNVALPLFESMASMHAGAGRMLN
jgi:hypothetical protein